MKLCGRECKVLNILMVRLGFESQQDSLIFFFFFFFFAFNFFKQSFKMGFNIKFKLKTILSMFTVTDKLLNQNIWFPLKYYSFARKC